VSRIAIIGAGLSGRLLALNLLRLRSSRPVSILMLDRGDERSMGPAYSDDADHLLLNVPADRMGATAEDPEEFLRWSRDRDAGVGPWDFLPRRWYRDYVLALLREALEARADGTTFEQIQGEVTDIAVEGDRVTIHAEPKGPVVVDAAVLALGNFPPPHAFTADRSALESERYIRNPWRPGVLDALSRRDTVLLIGTGQTTSDLLVGLHRRGHEGRIIALSRRGFLPLAHRGFERYESFFTELKESKTILGIFRIVRAHLDRAESMGCDPRAVIDSLRPDTQTIWLGLAEDEKRRFLRHLFRYWEIIRSRIPPQNEAILDAMRASGQLTILAGRIRRVVETQTEMDVHYVPAGGTTARSRSAALVINTVGPESDYRRIDDVLVRNLMRRGLIRPGPAHLGLDALPSGAIIGRDGAASQLLHTLGSTMRGVLWEVLAVPEIRVQAKQLARVLLAGSSST
jgi:uncharacterized NAD(P)/FAD-binding protein YdhS